MITTTKLDIERLHANKDPQARNVGHTFDALYRLISSLQEGETGVYLVGRQSDARYLTPSIRTICDHLELPIEKHLRSRDTFMLGGRRRLIVLSLALPDQLRGFRYKYEEDHAAKLSYNHGCPSSFYWDCKRLIEIGGTRPET